MPRRCRLSPSWDALVAAQQHVVSRRQALGCGWTDEAIRARLGSRQWQALLPGVYLLGPGAPSVQQRHWAALLHGGPRAALDDVTVLRELGCRHAPDDGRLVRVVVPRAVRVRSTRFVSVRRTSLPVDLDRRAPVRRVTPAHAAVWAGHRLGVLRPARAVVAEVVQRRLATPGEVASVAARLPRRGSAAVRRAVADVVDGCLSAPEAEALALVRRSRVLPEPRINRLVGDGVRVLGSPDGWFIEAALAWEVVGRDVHGLLGDREGDERRSSGLVAGGLTIMEVSPRRLREEGLVWRGELEAAYLHGLARGPAPGLVDMGPLRP